MKIFRNLDELPVFENQVITIGTFDGVHKGHRSILEIVEQYKQKVSGESMVLTFWPHPRMVLQPDNNDLKLLNTPEEKMEQFEKAGIDNLVIIPFTREFSKLSYLDFIRQILVDKLKVKILVVGYDHHFGKNREGSFEQLSECAPTYNFEVVKVPAEQIDDIAISSTKIRKALLDGDVRKAAGYLGYFYNVIGEVEHGEKRGRNLGYPTANIALLNDYKLLPAIGIYAVKVGYKGKMYNGMASLGYNPTFNGTVKKLEVNIFDFDSMVYGANLSVYFMDKLRNELTFAHIDELKRQLALDKEQALSILTNLTTTA